ncbi:hypothetical protein [Scytonema sp. NUACC21]
MSQFDNLLREDAEYVLNLPEHLATIRSKISLKFWLELICVYTDFIFCD